MIESWITRIGIGVGIALAAGYVIHTLMRKRKPELPVAMTCLLTGGGFVVGPVLVYGAFDGEVAKQSLKPEHLAIAGLAILWVSVQFVWSLKVSGGKPLEAVPAESAGGSELRASSTSETDCANGIPTLSSATTTTSPLSVESSNQPR